MSHSKCSRKLTWTLKWPFDQADYFLLFPQSEMLQAVIRQNSIIYLPTGAGKTFIAFMAMKHFYPQIEKYFLNTKLY